MLAMPLGHKAWAALLAKDNGNAKAKVGCGFIALLFRKLN